MCCIFTALVVLGPRAAIFLWWLFQPVRWSATFDTAVWPFVGFLFVPWTTLMYVLVYPGGIDTLDWLGLGMAFAFDIFNWVGGFWGNRRRIEVYTRY